jgi:predicted transcriptional regulator
MRSLPEEWGIAGDHLAYEAKLTVSSLAHIELGQPDPRWTTVKGIARALVVPLAQVVTRASMGA